MTILYSFALLIAVPAGWFLAPFGLRLLSAARLRRHCRDQRAIVLSYDDGPSALLLPRLLDLLAEHQVGATFFLLGRNAEDRPDGVRQLLEAGHEVGSHTFHHANAWKTWPWTAARDLARGVRSLRRQGAAADSFRPPYGKTTPAMLAQCRLRGLRLGWWTIDDRDTWARRPIPEVIGEIEAQGGGVVLMHDLDTVDPPAGGEPHADYVLDLTRGIIDFAARNGFQIKRLRDVHAEAAG